MEIKNKRVDIRLHPNKIVRGTAEIRDDGGVSIVYKKVEYRTPEELKRDLDFTEIVCGDAVFVDSLIRAGYPARSVVKARESLHVTIPVQLIEKIQNDAYESHRTTSAVVEMILREYYKF